MDTPVPRSEGDSLAPLMEWALAHLDRPITIAELAHREHVTPRTLIRRFRAATGTSPLRWLLAQRVRQARLLLESTDESPARVAQLSGLGGEANLRHHFARTVGIPPAEYRRAFRSVVST